MKRIKKDKEFQFGNVLIISISHMVHDIYSSFLAPLLPLLIEKFGMTLRFAGLLAVIQRLPSLLNPFVGLIADKIRMRYMIIAAPSVTTITMSLLGVAPYKIVLIVLLFIMGLSSTLFHVPSPVMIKRLSGNRTGKGMSFFMLGGESARTLGPIIIVGAVSLWGLEGTYKLIPFGIIASILLYLRIGKVNISKDFKKQTITTGAWQTLKIFLPVFFSITGVTFFRAFMKSALTIFLPTYLVAKGQSFWLAGISLAIIQGAGAIGAIFSGSLSDKIGRRYALIVVSIASPILMWLFILFEGNYTIVFLIIMGFFVVAIEPVFLALVQDINSEHPAFLNGIYMTINFFIRSVAVIIIGVLADWIGLEITYMIAASLAVISIPFAFRIKNIE